jgi:hypothetical protein
MAYNEKGVSMFLLEVFDGNSWETVAEFFDSVEDAEVYYNNQLGGFLDFRIVEG